MSKQKMNPIKWLINDIKGDINFFKSISDGTYKLPKHLRGVTFKKIFIETVTWKFGWLIFLLIGMAIVGGWFYGTASTQAICNEYINQVLLNTSASNPFTIPIGPDINFTNITVFSSS